MPNLLLCLLSPLIVLSCPVRAMDQAPTGSAVDPLSVPYERFVLPNGLTVIVHEDRSAPMVALQVIYRVGSAHEQPGSTGFAHLFEHLFFTGTAHLTEEALLRETRELGQVERVAITKWDSTHFGATMPTSSLDRAMWVEADRMGHFLSAFTQDKLDRARGVVQNERRRVLAQPYPTSTNAIPEASYPPDHPYAHDAIGSEPELNAATLEQAKEWFRRYYGPNNAILLLVGDIDPTTARTKAAHFFGDIPPGAAPVQVTRWVADGLGERRHFVTDRGPRPRLTMVWNVPEWGSPDAEYIGLISQVLDPSRGGRLSRLLGADREAADVTVTFDVRGLGSQLLLHASPNPSATLRQLETSVRDELRRLAADGPSTEEVAVARARAFSDFARGQEVLGQYVNPPDKPSYLRDEGKSAVLGFGELNYRDPGKHAERVRAVQNATAADLQRVTARWLAEPSAVIEAEPEQAFHAAASGVDRTAPPPVPVPPPARLPVLRRFTLRNGLKVVVADRGTAPTVQMELIVGIGAASDNEAPPGTALLLADLLDEPMGTHTPIQQAHATVKSRLSLQHTFVSVATLTDHVAHAVALLARAVKTPSIDVHAVERSRLAHLTQVQDEQRAVGRILDRALPRLLYGTESPLAVSMTSYTPTAEALRRVSVDDLKRLHERWYRPNNATLVIAGMVDAASLRASIEQQFADWARAEVPKPASPRTSSPDHSVVYVIDVPGSAQSSINAAYILPAYPHPQEAALQAASAIQSARLTQNLRIEKGWVYFARTYISRDEGPRTFLAYANPQLDKTAAAIQEIRKELQAVVGDRPITGEELARYQRSEAMLRGTGWQTAQELASALATLQQFELPDEYPVQSARAIAALDVGAVNRATKDNIRPDRMVWLVIGDAAKIEADVRALALGEVRRVDAEGRLVLR